MLGGEFPIPSVFLRRAEKHKKTKGVIRQNREEEHELVFQLPF